MTKGGTFVINGAERVIVSQIVRSPGVYYARNADKADNITYAVTVIPTGAPGWSMRPTCRTSATSASTKTGSSPSPA